MHFTCILFPVDIECKAEFSARKSYSLETLSSCYRNPQLLYAMLEPFFSWAHGLMCSMVWSAINKHRMCTRDAWQIWLGFINMNAKAKDREWTENIHTHTQRVRQKKQEYKFKVKCYGFSTLGYQLFPGYWAHDCYILIRFKEEINKNNNSNKQPRLQSEWANPFVLS